MKKILFFLLFLISISANATNYYVKTSGNDGNTGLSDAQAWKTVGKVYDERANFLPGDSILFRAGNTFTQTDANDEVLYITVSGTQYLHIVYSSYGAGAKPIFTAIDTVSGAQNPASWSEYLGGGTHIWRMAWPRTFGTINRERIWLNGVEQVRKKNRTVTAAEPVFSSGDSLYIYNAVGNPAAQYTTIRCHSDWQVFVQAYDLEYIDIANLDIRGYTEAMAFGGVDHFNIHDCNIGYDCGTDGIAISRATTSTRYVNIYNNTFQTNDTISMHTWEAKNTEDGVRIGSDSYYINVYNNEFYNWDHTGVYIYASDFVYPISNVKVYNNYFTANDIDYGRALGGDIRNESQALNIEVYNNYIDSMACQSQFQIPNAKIHHNIFTGTKEVWWSATHPDGHALSIQGYYAPTMGMEITNNVFANNTGVGLIINNDETYYETKGILIANNIFFGNIGHVLDQNYVDKGNSGLQMMIQDYTTTGDNDYKNNLFYKVGTTDLVYYGGGGLVDPVKTVAEFNALTGTDGDVIGDNINVSPLFTNGNGDYSDDSDFNLLAASLAINEGLDVDLVSDYLGNPIPIGPTPDIGAYEFISYNPTGIGWQPIYFKNNFRTNVNFTEEPTIAGAPLGISVLTSAGITASVNDLNATEGATSNFQIQINSIAGADTTHLSNRIDAKADTSNQSFTGTTVISKLNVGSAASATKAVVDSSAFVGTQIADYVEADTTTRYTKHSDRQQLDAALLFSKTTDTLSTKAYARSVGGGGSGTGDVLLADTIPLMMFNVGNGIDSDTLKFATTSVYEAFYNGWADTLHVTALKAVMLHGAGNDTLGLQISWDDTLKSANCTNLNTAALPIGRPTGIYTGVLDVSFANSLIPPGVWVWAHTPYVPAAALKRKPEGLFATMLGYKTRGLNPADAPVTYETEYNAVLAAMATDPSVDIKTKQNAMVKSLVDGGWWARMKQLLVPATEVNTGGEALVNWITPGTFNADNVHATAWTTLVGYGPGDGANDYISTNFIPATDGGTTYTLNSGAIGVYLMVDQQEDGKYVFGEVTSGANVNLTSRSTTNVAAWYINSGDGEGTPNTKSSGLMIVSRTASNACALYRNGVSLEAVADASEGLPNDEVWILGRNPNGDFSTNTVAIYFVMNGVVNATEAAALNTIFETYMDAIGHGMQP